MKPIKARDSPCQVTSEQDTTYQPSWLAHCPARLLFDFFLPLPPFQKVVFCSFSYFLLLLLLLFWLCKQFYKFYKSLLGRLFWWRWLGQDRGAVSNSVPSNSVKDESSSRSRPVAAKCREPHNTAILLHKIGGGFKHHTVGVYTLEILYMQITY